MNVLKLSATALALASFPMFASAQDTTALESKRIVGKCSFEAPDQSQEDDCHAKFVICAENNASRECRNVLKVTCGNDVEFRGEVEASVETDSVVLEGVANTRFPDAPTITIDRPTTLPATEDATLELDSVEQSGTCHIRQHGGGDSMLQ